VLGHLFASKRLFDAVRFHYNLSLKLLIWLKSKFMHFY